MKRLTTNISSYKLAYVDSPFGPAVPPQGVRLKRGDSPCTTISLTLREVQPAPQPPIEQQETRRDLGGPIMIVRNSIATKTAKATTR